MADLPKRFFFVGDEAPGAQLLAEIKQLHAEVTQSGDVWISKVFRVAAKTQEAWEKAMEYYNRSRGEFFHSLSFVSGIKERTLQWYLQIFDNKDAIEAARAEGQVMNQAAVRLLIVKPKKEKAISYLSQDDGWHEREAQHFHKNEVTLKPDEGAWGIFLLNHFFARADNLKTAKEIGEGLLKSKNLPPNQHGVHNPWDSIRHELPVAPPDSSPHKPVLEQTQDAPALISVGQEGDEGANRQPQELPATPDDAPVTAAQPSQANAVAANYEPQDAKIDGATDDDPNLQWMLVGDTYTTVDYSYRIEVCRGTIHRLWHSLGAVTKLGDYETSDEAKAAAQAHYDHEESKGWALYAHPPTTDMADRLWFQALSEAKNHARSLCCFKTAPVWIWDPAEARWENVKKSKEIGWSFVIYQEDEVQKTGQQPIVMEPGDGTRSLAVVQAPANEGRNQCFPGFPIDHDQVLWGNYVIRNPIENGNPSPVWQLFRQKPWQFIDDYPSFDAAKEGAYFWREEQAILDAKNAADQGKIQPSGGSGTNKEMQAAQETAEKPSEAPQANSSRYHPQTNPNGQKYTTRLSNGEEVPFSGKSQVFADCRDFGWTAKGTLEFFYGFSDAPDKVLLNGGMYGDVRKQLEALARAEAKPPATADHEPEDAKIDGAIDDDPNDEEEHQDPTGGWALYACNDADDMTRTWFQTLDDAKDAAKKVCGKKLTWEWDDCEERWENTDKTEKVNGWGFTIYQEPEDATGRVPDDDARERGDPIPPPEDAKYSLWYEYKRLGYFSDYEEARKFALDHAEKECNRIGHRFRKATCDIVHEGKLVRNLPIMRNSGYAVGPVNYVQKPFKPGEYRKFIEARLGEDALYFVDEEGLQWAWSPTDGSIDEVLGALMGRGRKDK